MNTNSVLIILSQFLPLAFGLYRLSLRKISVMTLRLSWVFRHKLEIIYIHIGFYWNLISAVVESTCFLIFHLFFHVSTFNSAVKYFVIHLCVVWNTILHLNRLKSKKSGWEWRWSSQAAVFLSDSSDRLLPIFLHPVSLIPFPPSLSLSPSFPFVPRLSLGQQELPSSAPRPVKDSGGLWGRGGAALY